MTRSTESEDDEDRWQDDDEEDDDGYIPCPHCGETMLEAADHCPYCDRWISSEEVATTRHPWWIIVVALILLFVFLLTAFRM